MFVGHDFQRGSEQTCRVMSYLEDDGRARSPSEHQDICAAYVTEEDQFVANPLANTKYFQKNLIR